MLLLSRLDTPSPLIPFVVPSGLACCCYTGRSFYTHQSNFWVSSSFLCCFFSCFLTKDIYFLQRKQSKARCKALCPLVQTYPFRDIFFKNKWFFYSELRKSLIIYFLRGSHTDLADLLGASVLMTTLIFQLRQHFLSFAKSFIFACVSQLHFPYTPLCMPFIWLHLWELVLSHHD